MNGKKVNISDFEKHMKRVENRLNNFIKQVC
jgi:fructose-specific component phosphotransferase system IIB-like protein